MGGTKEFNSLQAARLPSLLIPECSFLIEYGLPELGRVHGEQVARKIAIGFPRELNCESPHQQGKQLKLFRTSRRRGLREAKSTPRK